MFLFNRKSELRRRGMSCWNRRNHGENELWVFFFGFYLRTIMNSTRWNSIRTTLRIQAYTSFGKKKIKNRVHHNNNIVFLWLGPRICLGLALKCTNQSYGSAVGIFSIWLQFFWLFSFINTIFQILFNVISKI